jgi:hypothetical protein
MTYQVLSIHSCMFSQDTNKQKLIIQGIGAIPIGPSKDI